MIGDGSAFVVALEKIRRTVTELAQAPRRVAVIAAPKIDKLLRKQFTSGLNPYDRPWRPLLPSTLARGRRSPPLTDTRRLRAGTHATVSPGRRAGIQLIAGAPYGAFHQVGFHVGRTRVGPRKIFPDVGLPKAWRQVLDDAARTVARQARS